MYTIDNGLTLALPTKVSQDRGALLENLAITRERVFLYDPRLAGRTRLRRRPDG